MQNNDELRWCLSCSAFFIVLRGNGMIHFMVDWENVSNKGLKVDDVKFYVIFQVEYYEYPLYNIKKER